MVAPTFLKRTNKIAVQGLERISAGAEESPTLVQSSNHDGCIIEPFDEEASSDQSANSQRGPQETQLIDPRSHN